MKKVLVFYASYGGGHLSAARSIQEYIEKNNSEIQIELIDCMKYISKTIEKFTTAAYREMAKNFPWAWGKVYSDSQKGPLAHLSSRSNKFMAIKLLKLLREKQPDLIISTHPFGSQMCSYLKRKGKITSQIATVMTDFAPHDQWLIGSDEVSHFFVSNDTMKAQMIERGVLANKIFVTGIPISDRFLNSYDKSSICKEFDLDSSKETILFFGGGEFGLGKSKTLEILEVLATLPDSFQTIAISGKNEKMHTNFEGIVSKYHKELNIKVLSYTTKVPELMSISDVVVTKPGGLTTSESLASSLPMILINPIPGQEEENATFLEWYGVGLWLKKGMDIPKELTGLLQDKQRRNQMREKAIQLAKKEATANIYSILFPN